MDDRSHGIYKTRRQLVADNFLSGIAWGVGSVIGATIIVGVLGIVIVKTKQIPLIGDIVKVATDEISNGLQQIKNATNQTLQNSTPTTSTNTPVTSIPVSYP